MDKLCGGWREEKRESRKRGKEDGLRSLSLLGAVALISSNNNRWCPHIGVIYHQL